MNKYLAFILWIVIICLSVFLVWYIADNADSSGYDNIGWGIAKDNPIK